MQRDSTLVSRAKGSKPGKWHQKQGLQYYKVFFQEDQNTKKGKDTNWEHQDCDPIFTKEEEHQGCLLVGLKKRRRSNQRKKKMRQVAC